MTTPRDYDAELASLLKIIRDQSEGLPTPLALPSGDAGECEPILTWVAENSRGQERENAHS
jgi:hypothetical protein